jgi:glycosyltransferase involved in cell wall biosynthesis
MRIVYFTETFLPKIDGIVVTLMHLLEYLEKRGHKSIMFAPKGDVKTYASTQVVHKLSIRLPFYPEMRIALPIARVEKDVIEFKPDIIHLVNPTSLGLAGLRVASKHKIPVVASYHTDLPGFAKRWRLGFLAGPIYGYYRWIHNRADINLTPSKFTLEQLEAKGFKRLAVWKGGVDIARFHPSNFSKEWRRKLSDGYPAKPLVVYVGRLSKEKRVDWLLPIAKEIPGIRLAIVGDGPDRNRLEQLFEGTPTVFTGYKFGADLAAAYASGDVFAYTGADETYGNVVAEAMASGLPVVAPKSGGVVDLVDHGKTGYLYPPEDSRALLKYVKELTGDLDKARKLGKAGHKKGEQYAWEATLDPLLDIYKEVIKKSKRSAKTKAKVRG